MNEEYKKLKLIDLCARLLYDVMVDYEGHIYILNEIDPACKDIDYITVRIQDVERLMCAKSVMIENIKPFLRSMSSMTEEEKEELKTLFDAEEITSDSICYLEGGTLEEYLSHISYSFCSKIIDWLNRHHFDYRGLIEKGLALEAPEGTYK